MVGENDQGDLSVPDKGADQIPDKGADQIPDKGNGSLDEKFEEVLRERDQYRSMAQRDRAELINYRKRISDEMRDIRTDATSDLLLKTLTIVDDFERALAMIPDEAVAPGWRDGLELVLKNLNSLLEFEGVTRIETDGRMFDPWEFEAVSYEERRDAEEGAIVNVMRHGYRRRDKILRAAQVTVAKRIEIHDENEIDQEDCD